jgi:hypothetical protein
MRLLSKKLVVPNREIIHGYVFFALRRAPKVGQPVSAGVELRRRPIAAQGIVPQRQVEERGASIVKTAAFSVHASFRSRRKTDDDHRAIPLCRLAQPRRRS